MCNTAVLIYGFGNIFPGFMSNDAIIAVPLLSLIKGNEMNMDLWTECNMIFQLLKERLTTLQILDFLDTDKDFILGNDTSSGPIGAILSQKNIRG